LFCFVYYLLAEAGKVHDERLEKQRLGEINVRKEECVAAANIAAAEADANAQREIAKANKERAKKVAAAKIAAAEAEKKKQEEARAEQAKRDERAAEAEKKRQEEARAEQAKRDRECFESIERCQKKITYDKDGNKIEIMTWPKKKPGQ